MTCDIGGETVTSDRKSIAQQVKEILIQRIGSGELRPGDRVVEAKLAEEVQASSIPVREAIRELVAIGVLEFAPRRGAWVREVSLAEIIESLEVRAELDRLAAKRAAVNLRGRCRKLRATIPRIVAAAKRRDFVSFQEHNHEFHRLIVEAAENRPLLRVWKSLALDVRTRVIMDFLASVDPIDLAQEHEAIAEALDRGDGQKAGALLASHANHLVKYLQKEMAKQQKEGKRVVIR
jgi:DNA-binding GntR family transcriptional regulator